MIRVHCHRNNGADHHWEHDLTPIRALHSLVSAELAWGGTVTEISPERVVVKTQVMNCVDITAFSGSEDEMKMLVQLASLYQLIRYDHHDALVSGTVKALDQLPEGVRGKPLFITTLGPKMMGNLALRAALGTVMGVTREGDLRICATVPIEDLVGVIELHQETGLPINEVLSALQ